MSDSSDRPIPVTRALQGGVLMGLANLVPGISGGTMILAIGLYDRFIEAATGSGARSYVLKKDSPDEVITAIKSVLVGQPYYSPSVRERMQQTRGRSTGDTRLSSLSPRELETLRYIARGMAKKEIAPKMHISVKTVDKHVTQVMEKLGIHDRVELARYAIREGLVEL